MKKILRIILVGMMLIGLMVGCGSKQQASKLDPNKKAILVVSFGTSYADTRAATIEATEKRFAQAFPEYDVKRAFTSQIIIDKLKNRDNIEIDNTIEALDKLKSEGYGEVLIQPLHVINGQEYDDLVNEAMEYKEIFARLVISRPLLTSIEDHEMVADAIINNTPNLTQENALVLMGHGTHHDANAAYAQLDMILKDKGLKQGYVGTVEGYPGLEDIEKKLVDNNIDRVTLMPLMLVAGDHAQNDMAGDEAESWKMILKSKGYKVDVIMKGLGELTEIQDIYIEHLKTALEQ